MGAYARLSLENTPGMPKINLSQINATYFNLPQSTTVYYYRMKMPVFTFTMKQDQNEYLTARKHMSARHSNSIQSRIIIAFAK